MVLPPPWNPSPGGELARRISHPVERKTMAQSCPPAVLTCQHPPSHPAAAGGSNWQLGNNLTRERLAEDIAILQANLDNLPPSPEVSAPRGHRQQAADRQRTARPNQEIADAKLAKEIRDFDKAQFQLKQQKLVQSAIALGKSLIRSFAILQPDGTNFAKWFGNLAQISRTVMANPKFFHYPCLNSTYEKIGRAIILASIHDSLVAEIQTIDTCFMMYARLMMKLKTTSRALQMNTCYKFRAFNINPTGHNSGIALDLCDFHTKWAVINVKLTMDAFRGFILQVAVMDSGAPYQEAFELPIENLVQSNESRGCPPLDNIMKALDICKEQHHNTMVVTSLNSGFTSLLPPSALSTSIPDDDIFDPSAYLADIDQGEWVNALNFYPITANKCWQCGGDNHYARNCLDKSRAGATGWQTGQPLGTLVGTIYGHLPSGYPVNSNRFPKMQAQKTLAPAPGIKNAPKV
ncbi:hypothetical protein PSTG_13418 [Puccinia striiformis f. sp. tritici PST-78]|uniref:CCHC-type domain-containing protein n=1 Tax=Puccinia striiformis f. sp. tritici PST-78 TaxID=1165861 RepID=A0A0L0V1I3_9BASI|nr:hypothetical protein PSTG_13418 [Puccinia striiformis f. sp. tritici PST-78]